MLRGEKVSIVERRSEEEGRGFVKREQLRYTEKKKGTNERVRERE
jgi:hypothetical protein